MREQMVALMRTGPSCSCGSCVAGRPNHVRLASLASQNLDPKEKDRLAHLKELRHGKNDEIVRGVEEAEALLATHALPVPLGTSEEWRSRKRLCV